LLPPQILFTFQLLSPRDSDRQIEAAFPTPPPAFSVSWWQLTVLKIGMAYCIISIPTLPLMNALWWGEIPLLALIQLPKVAVASWLREHVVMEMIKMLGWSKGSFSPDYIMARPYGLGLTYSIPLILVSLSLLLPGCTAGQHRRWTLIFFAALLVDGVFTYFFASRRSFSLY
jgi:hypothetical protein